VLQQKRRGRPRSKPPKTSFKKAKEEEEEIPFPIFSREFRFNERLEARKTQILNIFPNMDQNIVMILLREASLREKFSSIMDDICNQDELL